MKNSKLELPYRKYMNVGYLYSHDYPEALGSNYTKYGFFPMSAYNNNEIKERSFENIKRLGAASIQAGSKRAAGITVSNWETCPENNENTRMRALFGLTTYTNTMKRQLLSNYSRQSQIFST